MACGHIEPEQKCTSTSRSRWYGAVAIRADRRKAAAVAVMIDRSKIQLQGIVKHAERRHKGSDSNPRRHAMS